MTRKLNVLLVDSDKEMTKYLRMYLEKKGISVSVGHNVSEALSALEKQNFDAMIIDVYLEKFSGISLLKSIKGREDLTPVIMMSAHATQEVAMECLNLGAYDFLFKPFRLRVVEDILHGIQQRNIRLSNMGVI